MRVAPKDKLQVLAYAPSKIVQSPHSPNKHAPSNSNDVPVAGNSGRGAIAHSVSKKGLNQKAAVQTPRSCNPMLIRFAITANLGVKAAASGFCSRQLVQKLTTSATL